MTPHAQIFKRFFRKCDQKDVQPSFEAFIKERQQYIQSHCDKKDAAEFDNWLYWFSVHAKDHSVSFVKGNAKKAWLSLIVERSTISKPATKRSIYTSNVIEAIDGLPTINTKGDLVFEDVDVEVELNKKFSIYVEYFKSSSKKNLSADVNKLLILQKILVLKKAGNEPIGDALNSQYLSRFRLFMRNHLFGKPKKVKESLKSHLTDMFEAFEESYDVDELDEQLRLLKKNSTDAEKRVINVLINLLGHMTLKAGTKGEMRLQSNVVPAVCHIFKASNIHAPQGCDRVLYNVDSVKRCRPDYIVEVQENRPYTNVVGEIKRSMASANGVALDQYRLALFGVNMLVVDNLKHSMVFQVIGQSMKFYLCSLAGGICLMLEVGSLVLPTTYQEFASFSTSINCLYDIALLYDEHCVKEDASEARSWQLLAFDAFKSLFGISTCKTSTVASEALSSTERCL